MAILIVSEGQHRRWRSKILRKTAVAVVVSWCAVARGQEFEAASVKPVRAGVDLTGQWHATVSVQSQKAELNLSLHQRSNSLTGSVQIEDKLFEIGKGSVQGITVSFSTMIPTGGKLVEVPFHGRIEGEYIRLDLGGVDCVASRVPAKPGAERIERLSGLFRLWGIVKFFHPYVVRGVVDWDAPLLKAIPKVEAAKTGDEFRAAVESMMAELQDPATRVLRQDETVTVDRTPNQRRLVRSGYYPQIGDTGQEYYAAWEPVGPTPAFVAEFSEGLRASIRVTEPTSAQAELVSTEKTYGSSLPFIEHRLLASARFWNTIHYFYGFPENIPNWDAILPEFIPQFESAATWRDYVFAIARLASKTNDSHSWIPEFWRQLGSAPPVVVWPVDGQSVVRDVAPEV